MKINKLKLYIISQELFQFSLITYLILLLIQMVKVEFISNFLFLLNILLGVIFSSGFIMVITSDKRIITKPKNS